MKPSNAEKSTRAFVAPAMIALFALASCVAGKSSTSEDERPTTGNPALVRYPPGPECPTGESMAGVTPHFFCMSEDLYSELAGVEE
jgi:hypothetical protein